MPGKTTRKKPVATSAGAAGIASSTAGTVLAKTTCVICCQSLHPGKDEALFCAGRCQQWLHRYCASVSVEAYRSIKEDGSSFSCYDCYRGNKDAQLSQLERTVLELRAEISQLRSSLTGPETTVADSPQNTERTYASTAAANVGESTYRASPSTTIRRVSHSYTDRKFNVILYGIDECLPGSSRASRLESDLNNAVSVLSSIESTIQAQSIKDCYRLGKFSSSSTRPRPILIKMIRASNVSKIMTKRHLLQRPYFIKHDMPREQRIVENVLLKERWKIIQSGVSHLHIRIKNSQLFVNGELYGQVINSKFHCVKNSSVQQSQSNTYPSPPGSPRQSLSASIVQPDNRSECHVQNTPVSDNSLVSNSCHQNESNSASVSGTADLKSPQT